MNDSIHASNTTVLTRAATQEHYSDAAPARGSREFYLKVKRGMDFAIALGSLLLLSPVLLVIASAIKLDSRGPAVFAQERVGWDRRRRQPKTFMVFKFRSMVNNADQKVHEKLVQEWIQGQRGASGSGESSELVKLAKDSRVTRVGKFLRRTSLDELAQLFNVLKGDMSLVGPRPVPLYEVAEYEPWHLRRLHATPGITCLWQVEGRGVSSIDEMVRLDIEYIERQSLRLDVELLLKTIPVVLSGRGAV